jgi:hypothetical protein
MALSDDSDDLLRSPTARFVNLIFVNNGYHNRSYNNICMYYKAWRFLNMTCHDFQFGQDLVICTRRIKSAGFGKLLSKLFTEK